MEKFVLHLGNILNNGYLHCKYLRKRNIEAECLNLGYAHCQGQPEWAEVHIKGIVDQFDPDWSKVDIGGFLRPSWYIYEELKDIENVQNCIHTKNACAEDNNSACQVVPFHWYHLNEDYLRYAYKKYTPIIGDTLIGKVLKKLHVGSTFRSIVGWQDIGDTNVYNDRVHNSVLDATAQSEQNDYQTYYYLLEEFKAFYPDREKVLTMEDIKEWIYNSLCRRRLFNQYKLIHAYSLDPIYAMLGNQGQPFICYEHGTMREFPFEDSSRGRLYALALQKAEKVIITNADCNRSAEKIGLNNYVFIPHIIDDELFRPSDNSPLREKLIKQNNCDYIFVAPSRHHWKNCPAGLENSWFKRNDILIRGLGRLFHERPALRALVVFFEWGQEIELSKRLIRDCGFEEKVLWEPIMSKPALKDYFQAADIILDQFNDGIGTFGAVVPEAMACRKPVVLNYKKELHAWCYPELPPAIHAWDEDSLSTNLKGLIDNEAYRKEVGEKGFQWFKKYHSSKIVIDKMIDLYVDIAEKKGWRWNDMLHRGGCLECLTR